MSDDVTIRSAVPVLASLDIQRSVDFFAAHLGFTPVYAVQGSYGIDALYEQVAPRGIVHPNGPLEHKPWGTREFTVVDPDGNAVVFVE